MDLLQSPLRAERERGPVPGAPHTALPPAQNAGKGPTACEHSRDRAFAPWAVAPVARPQPTRGMDARDAKR